MVSQPMIVSMYLEPQSLPARPSPTDKALLVIGVLGVCMPGYDRHVLQLFRCTTTGSVEGTKHYICVSPIGTLTVAVLSFEYALTAANNAGFTRFVLRCSRTLVWRS